MITPAQAFLLSTAGNSAMCVTLPRKQVTDIHLNGSQIQDIPEADAGGWRFFGLAGGAACAAVYLADKNINNADDRKILNGAIAANAIGNAALFVQHKFMEDHVKPEMRWLNLGMQAGVAGLAVKALLDKK